MERGDEKAGGCNGWKPFLVMLSIDFAFAVVNILLKTVLDQGMNHLVFITYRLCISTIFLAPIAYFWERSTRPKLTFRILCYLFFSSIVGSSLTQYLFLLGIQNTSATFACAFINIVPVITFIMALPLGTEKVDIKCSSGKAKVAGTVICVGGAMILTLYRGKALFNLHADTSSVKVGTTTTRTSGSGRWSIGLVGLVLGTFLWSSWFLIQAKIATRFPCQYSSTTIMSFFGSIQSVVLCFALGSSPSVWVIKGKVQILTVLYAGIVGSGLCFVGMAWCVKKRGPVFTAAFSPLIQVMAAAIDIPILHEQLHFGSLLGSIIVMIGLYILLWGKNKEMQIFASRIARDKEVADTVQLKIQQDHQEPKTVNNNAPQPLLSTVK